MKQTLKFVKLDFITVKPYLTIKNLLILLFVTAILSFSGDVVPMSAVMVMLFGSLYVNYPFAVGEQNGIDLLYATLPLRRNNVVLGRYFFAAIIHLCSGVLSFALPCLFSVLFQSKLDFKTLLPMILAVFFMCSVLHIIQLPLFFKLGYAKSKVAVFVTFTVIPVATSVLLSAGMASSSPTVIRNLIFWCVQHAVALILVLLIVWLAMIVVSYRLSLRFYQKRQF